MALERFFDEIDAPERSLVCVNRSGPEPVRALIERLFDRQPVEVEERTLPEVDDDTVLLVEDGEVVASSPLPALQRAILMVNSDLFTTGARDLDDAAVPAVIDGLAEVPFTLRGYPESDQEKLLLIAISRHIERLAWRRDAGRLRTSFQRLSRLEDEHGTRGLRAPRRLGGRRPRLRPPGLDAVAGVPGDGPRRLQARLPRRVVRRVQPARR